MVRPFFIYFFSSFLPFFLFPSSINPTLSIPAESDSEPGEMVFLLSGGDNRVHLFREDPLSQLFQEQPVGKYFPELDRVQNKVLSLSIETSGTHRLVVAGCQDGTLQLVIGPVRFSESDLKDEGLSESLFCFVMFFFWLPSGSHWLTSQTFRCTKRLLMGPFLLCASLRRAQKVRSALS